MSNFEVNVVRIDEVMNHPDADRLSLNRIGGYIAVSNKQLLCSDILAGVDVFVHRYSAGQLVVYVPEGAVVPLDVLEQYGYAHEGKGILAGSKGNRVKAIKLRGVLSQGLIFPLGYNGRLGDHDVVIGQNVADLLGIVKYEPAIPASMGGDVFYCPSLTLKFDIENQQKYPDVFQDNDYVYATEKLHGTFAGFVFITDLYAQRNEINVDNLLLLQTGLYATAFSKGLGSQGLVFKATPQNIERNVYLRALVTLTNNEEVLIELRFNAEYGDGKLTVLGEVYGKGIQDLTYSLDSPSFAAFNAVLRSNNEERYMAAEHFYSDESPLDSIPRVPLVYQGPYSALIENIEMYRDGKSFVDGITLREGIVVVPDTEGRDDRIGRKAVKMISPEYLLRKGGTELN
jgi:RNA ligase (TIGR02306 family)